MAPTKIQRTDEEWKKLLTSEQYEVLRQKGTERPFSGAYCEAFGPGTYACAGCGQELFVADAKFDSGTGWPSFRKPIAPDRVEEHRDVGHGMVRVEVVCSACGGHLGHVFPDGPPPEGKRYCMNSISLKKI